MVTSHLAGLLMSRITHSVQPVLLPYTEKPTTGFCCVAGLFTGYVPEAGTYCSKCKIIEIVDSNRPALRQLAEIMSLKELGSFQHSKINFP